MPRKKSHLTRRKCKSKVRKSKFTNDGNIEISNTIEEIKIDLRNPGFTHHMLPLRSHDVCLKDEYAPHGWRFCDCECALPYKTKFHTKIVYEDDASITIKDEPLRIKEENNEDIDSMQPICNITAVENADFWRNQPSTEINRDDMRVKVEYVSADACAHEYTTNLHTQILYEYDASMTIKDEPLQFKEELIDEIGSM